VDLLFYGHLQLLSEDKVQLVIHLHCRQKSEIQSMVEWSETPLIWRPGINVFISKVCSIQVDQQSGNESLCEAIVHNEITTMYSWGPVRSLEAACCVAIAPKSGDGRQPTDALLTI